MKQKQTFSLALTNLFAGVNEKNNVRKVRKQMERKRPKQTSTEAVADGLRASVNYFRYFTNVVFQIDKYSR